ncbi:uracil-DNA glycosylase [Candidatus Haliotispira prima]|uniref:Uracil-DNA glycosylase n=1 Tax=Candidatus Haliotispira prima TaxID=3034016 RepID=A0ABY8MJ56_9SPIO|nr:uracil-DNA glycosylase [Candidatus Haliotispira prima]
MDGTERDGAKVGTKAGVAGLTRQLWMQLWACATRLQRELSEEPYELCWRRSQAPFPPFRLRTSEEGRNEETKSEEVKNEEPKWDGPSADQVPVVRTSISPREIESSADTKADANPARVNPVRVAEDQTENRTQDGVQDQAKQTQVQKASWQEAIVQCQACHLGQETTRIRRQAIVGYPEQRLSDREKVELLLVCDAPNWDADQEGVPLAPDSLEYLSKWLEAIRMSESYYLTNLVKCRTPGNRAAWPEEIKSCTSHLKQQLQLFRPKAILALGSSAARSLSRQRSDLNTLRSRELYYEFADRQVPLFVTYSVAEVLQNPNELRAPVWEDLKRLRAFLGQNSQT